MEKVAVRFWSTEKRRDTVRLLGITAFNGILTVFTGARSLGGAENAFSVDGPLLVEAAHDVGDTAVTGARAVALQTSTHEKSWFRSFRRATYAVVSTIALVAVAKSSIELVETIKDTIDNGFSWNELEENFDNVVNGGVISLGNQASYVVSQTLEEENEIVHDAKHHAKVDRDTSLILAGFITAGAVVPYVAEAAGVGTGIYTAWHMRPTNNNLDHKH
jgi:hypothetical protein